jgi:hypothetical protein
MLACALTFMLDDFFLLDFCIEPLKKPFIKKAPVWCVSSSKEEPAILVFASFFQKLSNGWEMLIFEKRCGFKEFL